MNKTIFFIAAYIMGLISCTANRALQNERVLFPDIKAGKWWIINSVAKDKAGKDVHYASLMSIDRSNGKNYASCFTAVWYEFDSSYYSGTRNTSDPKVKTKTSFPLKIKLPGIDSTAKEWSWVLKRKSLLLQTELTGKDKKNIFTELSSRFDEQNPFRLTEMNASPEIWAVAPIAGKTDITRGDQSAHSGKILVRIFSGKNIFFAAATHDYISWVDLTLNNGKQLSILFRTNATGEIKTECILFRNDHDDLLSPPLIHLKTIKDNDIAVLHSRSYPLYFSLSLPGENISLFIRPRMLQQEIRINKNAFWMGAIEALDQRSNQNLGKGNMYIFKKQ